MSNFIFMEFKIHDVVTVERRHKEKEEGYWGNTTTPGVIVGLSDTQVTIKNKNGHQETFVFDDKDNTHAIFQYSEIEFRGDIEKAIADAKRTLERSQENMDDVTSWYHTFNHEVSFLGKMYRIFKEYGYKA